MLSPPAAEFRGDGIAEVHPVAPRARIEQRVNGLAGIGGAFG